MTSPRDDAWLDAVARAALRGHGGAEPNPLVGCVIVSDGSAVGWGHHRRCGGPHAEVNALRAAGDAARGATAYVTLEPCAHTGRTPPCTDALVAAGVARVVIGCADPNPEAAGGAARLRDAGIDVEVREHPPSRAILAPFAHRIATGLPWVCAKWAQTIDGRIATRTGASRWISGPASRRAVHRERGRVDAILTGAGTVLADDPLLTARGVRVRRVARRVVVDGALRTSTDAQLVQTAREVPTTIACTPDAARSDRARRLEAAGVEVLSIALGADGRPDLETLLREIVTRHDVAHVLVEAGATLLGACFDARLVQETWVFVAPMVLGDAEALPSVAGRVAKELADGVRMSWTRARRRGADIELRART